MLFQKKYSVQTLFLKLLCLSIKRDKIPFGWINQYQPAINNKAPTAG
jgi:hypothetical protein